MPNNPEKFSIKFWLAIDMLSKYLLNGYPYLGNDETRSYRKTVGTHATFCLIEHYYNTGRNLKMHNFFTSLKLVKQVKNEVIICVGRINHLKREVPRS